MIQGHTDDVTFKIVTFLWLLLLNLSFGEVKVDFMVKLLFCGNILANP